MSETNLKDYLQKSASVAKWKRIGINRKAGIVTPLFSVYSNKSLGIGDLEDLKLLIGWVSQTGNSIIQLLPMNEVGATFCPYDSVSSFALEPMYISLGKIPGINKNSFFALIDKRKREFSLTGKSRIDYRIKKEKISLFWDIFCTKECGVTGEFNQFIEENNYWLEDFAIFMALKNYHRGAAWYEWEDRYKDRDALELERFKQAHEKEIRFQIWMQWLAFSQFKEARQYAVSKKILLKGDLPILVSRDSADVWAHREFFKLDYAAGAPPDMYCAKGQRWGMPTYDWEAIAADEYRYLKEKLRYAQEFYDILRIDHVVGLFRIWSIPYNEPQENKGLNGFFDPKDENKWKEHGRNILSVILQNTNMLLCAEDLGIIPPVCPQTLKEFGIPGNDVQRWVKDWKVKHDFLNPRDYRALSVAMLSTHDTTNWAAWWENEAGTVDEALFIRKCADRKIDYISIKDKLFDFTRCGYGRLRWLDTLTSADSLVGILGKRKDELADFIEIYENTYQEKEKLWQHFKLRGPMREKADSEISKAAFRTTLESQAIFCIELITDWLMLAGIFKGGPYQYRINMPGTVSEDNWSLLMPMPLEDLLKHKANNEIRNLIAASARI